MMNFIKSLESIKSCTFCGITYRSDVKAPKKLGLGQVSKVVELNAQFNFSYETAVNNRLEKSGNARSFSADSLPFGSWLYRNKVIQYGNEFYVRIYCVKGQHPNTTFFVNGRPATDAEVATIKAWQATLSKGSAKQTASGLTDNQVEPRTINVKNIIAFKCGAIDYHEKVAIAV